MIALIFKIIKKFNFQKSNLIILSDDSTSSVNELGGNYCTDNC